MKRSKRILREIRNRGAQSVKRSSQFEKLHTRNAQHIYMLHVCHGCVQNWTGNLNQVSKPAVDQYFESEGVFICSATLFVYSTNVIAQIYLQC